MKFLKWLNPIPGIRDFVEEFARPHPYRWRILLAAIATTIALFSVMWKEEVVGPPPKPDIIWISTFAPNRTDAEIMAANVANQKVKDEIVADRVKRDAEVKEIYRKLGRMSGMDVDKIERDAAAADAAEAQAKAAAAQKAASTAGAPVAATTH